MKITRQQLRRIISESMKSLHSDIQDDILALGQDQGGKLTVDDVMAYLSGYANDPMGDPAADYVGSMGYDEVLQIMQDMVTGEILMPNRDGGFRVHPDYM